MLELIRNFTAQNIIVIALCLGPQVLLDAGLIKGSPGNSWKRPNSLVVDEQRIDQRRWKFVKQSVVGDIGILGSLVFLPNSHAALNPLVRRACQPIRRLSLLNCC